MWDNLGQSVKGKYTTRATGSYKRALDSPQEVVKLQPKKWMGGVHKEGVRGSNTTRSNTDPKPFLIEDSQTKEGKYTHAQTTDVSYCSLAVY